MAKNNHLDRALEKLNASFENRPKIKKPASEKLLKNSTKEDPFVKTKVPYLIVPATISTIEKEEFKDLKWCPKNAVGLIFIDCTFSNIDFSSADLSGIRLQRCKIFDCNFAKAHIKGGSFLDCNFYEKQQQTGCNFKAADLREAEFQRCDISMSNFERADAFQLTIVGCRAQGSNFNAANFVHIISRTVLFSAAYLTDTDFKYAIFDGVFLEKCDLSGSKFGAASFIRANLSGADLKNTYFAPGQYEGLSIFKADMRNAEICNIDIRKLDFSGVQILEWQQAFFMDNLGIIVSPEAK